MIYAAHIINEKDDNEVAERATNALQKSFDSFVQEAYNLANEEERDLIRKLRFLGKAKNDDDANDDDFFVGKMEALGIISDNPWNLLYDDASNDSKMCEEEKLYKKLSSPLYRDRPYEQHDLGEGMTLVNQVIGEDWKPRYLLDNEAKCAYEFMSIDEVLQIVTDEDIDWDSLKRLPQDAFDRAKAHSLSKAKGEFHRYNFLLSDRMRPCFCSITHVNKYMP